LLTHEFLEKSSSLDYKKANRGFFEAQSLARDLARLGPVPLLKLLQDPLSPEQAHLVARALLACTFLYSGLPNPHWESFPNYDRMPEGLFYLKHHTVARQRKSR
jgi:hypothetical protein